MCLGNIIQDAFAWHQRLVFKHRYPIHSLGTSMSVKDNDWAPHCVSLGCRGEIIQWRAHTYTNGYNTFEKIVVFVIVLCHGSRQSSEQGSKRAVSPCVCRNRNTGIQYKYLYENLWYKLERYLYRYSQYIDRYKLDVQPAHVVFRRC